MEPKDPEEEMGIADAAEEDNLDKVIADNSDGEDDGKENNLGELKGSIPIS